MKFAPVLLALGALLGCGGASPERISVVLISLDTLRSDALGSYGSRSARTPNLDRLAREGVLFENAISQAPATGPSFASIMTSLYPRDHGVLHSTMVLEEWNVTLAERFKAAGYRTGAFVSCSILDSRFGFAQGFDVYDDETSEAYAGSHFERDARHTGERARAWLSKQRQHPFFLWLHFFDAHAPYRDHPGQAAEGPLDAGPGVDREKRQRMGSYPYLRKLEKMRSRELLEQALPIIRSLYRAEVRHIDDQVGLVLQALRDIGWHERVLIVVAADHGEELFDHGFFHGHYRSLSESVLRVPLILWLPGRLPEGRRVSSLVENIDILPTILSLTGIAQPEGQSGDDLLRAIRSQADAEERIAWSMREPYEGMPGGNAVAVRDQRWKAVFYQKAAPRLYDLEHDRMEEQNLAQSFPERVESFRGRLDAWLGESPTATVSQTSLEERDFELLKTLGYVE